MKLYIGEQMVLPVLGRVVLRKRRSEAAATLSAVVYRAAADTYFQHLSIALGDRVRLLDDAGSEVFLGSIHELRRTPEQVELTALDSGVYLTKNELYGAFSGSPGEIVSQIAQALELPLGTVEAPSGWKTLLSRTGESAFSLLRRAVGEDREIAVQGGALTVTKSAYMVYVPEPSQVLEVSGEASLSGMVNRCVVVDRKGNAAAKAEAKEDIAAYGQMQTVLGKSGADASAQAAAALAGRAMTGEITLVGNLSYRCGCAVEMHRSEWGLDGVYAVTAAEHRWEAGIHTTRLELEFVR